MRFRIFIACGLGLGVAVSLIACGNTPPPAPLEPAEPASKDAARIQAIAYLREGRPRRAHLLLEGLPSLDSPDDLLLAGEAALRSGKFARAAEAYNRVLEIRPDDLVALGRLARIAFLEARFEDAETQLNWILARAPDHSEARGLRCRIRLQRGNLKGATADARRWVALSPGKAGPLSALGIALSRQQSWAEARSALEEALSLDSTYIPAWLELGRVYRELGEDSLSQKAILEVKTLTRKRREQAALVSAASYHRLRALDALEAGQPETAWEHFQQALAKDPQDPDLLREAGEAALEAGRHEEAFQLLTRAVTLAPREPLNLRARGEVALVLENAAGAIKDLLAAARLDPTDPRVHRALSKAYLAHNNPSESEREANLAIELEKASISGILLEGTP